MLTSLARQLGYGATDATWSLVLMVAGGHVGPLAWVMWALFGAVAVSVGVLAARAAVRPTGGA